MMVCSYCGRDTAALRPLDDECASCRVRSHIEREPLGISTAQLLTDTGLRIEPFCELVGNLRRQGRVTTQRRECGVVWVGVAA